MMLNKKLIKKFGKICEFCLNEISIEKSEVKDFHAAKKIFKKNWIPES